MTNDLWPRLLRVGKATKYLGMNIRLFNNEVRPYLTEIPIGKQGKAFDKLEIDAWIKHYMQCNGRPAKDRGITLWDAKKYPDSKNDLESGKLTKKSLDKEFAKVLEQVISKKQKES